MRESEIEQDGLTAIIFAEKPLIRFIRFLVHKTFYIEAINEANGEVMGHVNLRKQRGDVLKIEAVVTKEKYRGKGVATALYKYIEEHSKGYRVLKASVFDEASAALHEKTGFSSSDGKPFDEYDGITTYEKKLASDLARSKFSDKPEVVALQKSK